MAWRFRRMIPGFRKVKSWVRFKLALGGFESKTARRQQLQVVCPTPRGKAGSTSFINLSDSWLLHKVRIVRKYKCFPPLAACIQFLRS